MSIRRWSRWWGLRRSFGRSARFVGRGSGRGPMAPRGTRPGLRPGRPAPCADAAPRGSERLRAKAVAYVKKRMTVMRFLTHALQRRLSWRVSARLAWVGNETAHYARFRSPLGEPRPRTMPRRPGADHDPHPSVPRARPRPGARKRAGRRA